MLDGFWQRAPKHYFGYPDSHYFSWDNSSSAVRRWPVGPVFKTGSNSNSTHPVGSAFGGAPPNPDRVFEFWIHLVGLRIQPL